MVLRMRYIATFGAFAVLCVIDLALKIHELLGVCERFSLQFGSCQVIASFILVCSWVLFEVV
jgi:hypothetical protein